MNSQLPRGVAQRAQPMPCRQANDAEIAPSVRVPGPEKWQLCWALGSPPCSAGGGSLQAEVMALITEKAVRATCLTD